MKAPHVIIWSFLVIVLVGCSLDSGFDYSSSHEVVRRNVGDRWFYKRVKGGMDHLDYEFLNDTLALEVMDIQYPPNENPVFVIAEYFTPKSERLYPLYSDKPSDPWPIDTLTNLWQQRHDTLFVTNRQNDLPHSYLLLQDNNNRHAEKIPWYYFLMGPLVVEHIDLSGWKTNRTSEGDMQGVIRSFSLFGVDYGGVNVLINNSGLANHGPGATTVYNKTYGILQTAWYGPAYRSGYGWMRIPAKRK